MAEATLGRKVGKGLAWSTLNTIVGRIGQMVLGIALAHLIAPEQFGVYAAALVVLNVVISISELGVSVAIVQAGDEKEVDRIAPVVTTVSAASGVALAALMALTAPWLASALGAPAATGPIRVLALSLVLAGIAAVPGACLQREFRQDRKMVGDTVSFVVSTAVAVWMATAGYGAWSLAWSRVAGSLVMTVVLYALASRRYRPAWDAALAARLLRFGIPLAGASITVFAVLNVDYMIVGNILGPTALGIYVLAFNLSGWPVNAFSTPVRAISLPAFSELRSDAQRYTASFGRALGMLFVMVIPVSVLLGTLGLPLVRFVYGTRWSDAAGPLAFLAAVGASRVALELAYDFLVSAGEGDAALGLNILWLVTLIPTLIVCAHVGGITGVAAGHVIALVVVVVPTHLRVLRRLGVTTGSIVRPILRPLAGGAVMVAVVAWTTHVLSGDLVRLAGASLAGLVAYGAIVGLPLWRQHRRGELFSIDTAPALAEAAA
jgi:O-antigen/teichoic acid export membrane protein